jgi:hypothetical protein
VSFSRISEGSNSKPSDVMMALIEASWLSRAIHVVATLGIPDLLRDAPKRLEELATATSTHPQALNRIMRALAGEGLFTADEQDRFSLTPLGGTLRSDVPGSLRDWALLMLGSVHQDAWSEVIHSVRTGQSAFTHRYGMDLWQYCSRHPEHAQLFAAAMASFTSTYIENLLGSYSFSAFTRIIDVGGGDGSLLIGILQRHPNLQGLIYELGEVADRARHRIEEAGLASRCEVRTGDALVEVPSGGDAYILSRVLHDWDDEGARTILASCRRALPDRGRVLVIERTMPDSVREIASMRSPALSDITMTDLNMLVMTSGRERTLAEYQDLFERAGLELLRVVPTQTALNVMEVGAGGETC